MYENFFRLLHRPFAAAPAADSYVPTAALEQARATLVRVIERAEGPGLIVGPAGTGKTLACQLLARHFRGRFHVALLASARLCTRRAMLQNILFELKLPYRDLDDGELRLSLIDHLEPRNGGNDGLLLLVDEAHTLPLRLLEEVRLITNLVRDGQPRVRLVLAGGMAIEERLANPKLESFHQRIAARCYLQSMPRDETVYYVQEQLRRCGATTEVFSESALRSIHTASDGIPRLVNQLCDHALMLAALGGHRQLGPDGIEEAWADLQQLPTPTHAPIRTANEAAPAVVEFGQLDDAPRSPAAAASASEQVSSAAVTQIGPFHAEDEAVDAAATQVGPFHSEEGAAAEARLDAIESGLSSLREESGGPWPAELPAAAEPGDFSPADDSSTEVELIFHSAHDPFGGGWEEEEVVIDRYAQLDAARLRRVASDEGRELGVALRAAASPAASRSADGTESLDDEIAASDRPFDPASDPLLPEVGTIPLPSRRAVASLRELAGDDRDLIVVTDEPDRRASHRAVNPSAKPKRQEYRQLFSTLRKK